MIGEVPGNVFGMFADLIAYLGKLLKKKNPFAMSPTEEVGLEVLAEERAEMLLNWEEFYKEFFDEDVDFTHLQVPERLEGFDRLIVVAKGMTAQLVYDRCADSFPCMKYTDRSLSEVVPTNEREPSNGPYAIWVRDTVEADEVHKNKSANKIKRYSIRSETLLERLLHGLKFYKETGKHLDISNVTLCAGSRDWFGVVPRVYWIADWMEVYWCNPGDADDIFRAREVCS
ncbi:MAG TPA: hypothetical protein PKD79_04305 [Candidatus Doudnabacteria bacterium]|nr:hypothetical protein [Candidatus Doudnabacteria bacterium]